MYSCPLAMTDGATRLIEQLKLSKNVAYHPFLDECFKHLNSNDPKQFWTSGQWMTERTGGSDVSNSETVAVKNELSSDPKSYLLYGYKFFTSATTADITFALAKIKDPHTGKVKEGSRGLSLFVLKLRKPDGKMNNLLVHRLKDKLGTRSLPTAELELDGTEAILISNPGEGVKTISTLFNVTRIYCICSSAAGMRRMLALMRDYLSKREVFGEKLMNKAAHLKTMTKLEIMFRGTLQLFLDVVVLFGKSETNPTEKSESLLRLLTPIGKLFTTKQAVLVLSEGMESFGGYGYMEDTGIPSLLRDLHVNTIWEGTTNVLSLDLLRAVSKDPKSIHYFVESIEERINDASFEFKESISIIKETMKEIVSYCKVLKSKSQAFQEAGARDLAFTMSRCYIGSLLVEHAKWSNSKMDVYIANGWCTLEKMNTLSYNEDFTLEIEKSISLQSKL
jgi:putative acyl-CoA dehydrogenase